MKPAVRRVFVFFLLMGNKLLLVWGKGLGRYTLILSHKNFETRMNNHNANLMKNFLILLLLLAYNSAFSQSTARTTEQVEHLNNKKNFRNLVFGTPLPLFTERIEKELTNEKPNEKCFRFKNEDKKIGNLITAEFINYFFYFDKLSEVGIKIQSGSEELNKFLLREYGEPDVKNINQIDTTIQFFCWRGKYVFIQLYYNQGKENAFFQIASNEYSSPDTQTRNGF
jgi:hypothetical protein